MNIFCHVIRDVITQQDAVAIFGPKKGTAGKYVGNHYCIRCTKVGKVDENNIKNCDNNYLGTFLAAELGIIYESIRMVFKSSVVPKLS